MSEDVGSVSEGCKDGGRRNTRMKEFNDVKMLLSCTAGLVKWISTINKGV